VLWPEQITTVPGVTVQVGILNGSAIEVLCLEGRVTFSRALSARAARPSEALTAAGFHVFFALDEVGSARFLVRSLDEEPRSVPAGTLFEIELAIPDGAPAVYDLSVEGLESKPTTLLRGWSNAIVVLPS
jgi:hypothetical protein